VTLLVTPIDHCSQGSIRAASASDLRETASVKIDKITPDSAAGILCPHVFPTLQQAFGGKCRYAGLPVIVAFLP